MDTCDVIGCWNDIHGWWCHLTNEPVIGEGKNTMDAADELAAMILERLDVLNEINQNTFNSGHPTNCGPIQRWIEDVRGRVTRFNLKGVTVPENPLLTPCSDPFQYPNPAT
ncbi:hypothetical protein [Mycobacterium sp. E1747]|uniref:hypothetical protein n=1 Tax=Mycobacterium sp. E1747 TaxID=1834128 RepID=UPI0007FCA862|nr:hypothetical protein [Mycobacterium sp. E1747]OBH08951.1 hypothetical protein A5695_25280 [Mycobacterium sp. E1747]